MNKYIKTLLCCLLVTTANYGLAQKLRVSGRILADSISTPLVSANVFLERASDTTIVNHSITDENGVFGMFTNPGEYLVTFTHIGYDNLVKNITLDSTDLNLGDVYLSQGVNDLYTVTIEGEQTRITIEGDTTEYNADFYVTNPDATAENLLEKMPGFRNKDGSTQAEGENIQRVLVDGKPFFGDDPNAALKNIPAEIIDKIQVYDQQSDQSQFTGFDDGNTVKTVNIVTKENSEMEVLEISMQEPEMVDCTKPEETSIDLTMLRGFLFLDKATTLISKILAQKILPVWSVETVVAEEEEEEANIEVVAEVSFWFQNKEVSIPRMPEGLIILMNGVKNLR